LLGPPTNRILALFVVTPPKEQRQEKEKEMNYTEKRKKRKRE
jgi:hypothetical protein